ncbi:hypothetical protein N1851_002422 [Merluccius polli]|uniref:Uncharacterized protein n=1 Tax=Merluccius polli TaxID=89951 RepID=A0AA47NBQ1_MERPO|nr:hypothetical protein N1851_002422 [Merluccius polli]
MDVCVVSIVCPCNSVTNKLVRLGEKSFANVLKEVKQCACSFVSAASKVDRADRWTDIASDVVSTSPVSSIASLFQFKYLALKCAPEQISVSSTSTTNPSAFEMLFRAQQRTHLPPPKVVQTKKDELKDDILKNLRTREVGFSLPESTTQGSLLLTTLTNCLWYITNQHTVIRDASLQERDVIPVPSCWSFEGYNKVKRKKMKEQPMCAAFLDSHSQALLSLCDRPYMSSTAAWRTLKEDILSLATCLHNYVEYLKRKRDTTFANHNSSQPVRVLSDNIAVTHHKNTPDVAARYLLLDNVMCQTDTLTHVLLDDTVHLEEPFASSWHRFEFINRIQLSVPVDVLKYQPGGRKTGITFLWKVERNRTQDEQLTQTIRVVSSLQPFLPQYHTRYMKKDFKRKVANVARVTPSIVEAIYQEISHDSSAPSNPLMNQCIQVALQGEPGIIVDLRTLNSGRPGDNFEEFFSKMEEAWLSLENLIEQVKSKCPEGTRVPSKALVRLQFAPKNPYTQSALNFTSRFELKYKIQRRQLRASHHDAHFCAALFKLLRLRRYQLRSEIFVVFMDDKAKIPVGEPGEPVSTGVRGRHSIYTCNPMSLVSQRVHGTVASLQAYRNAAATVRLAQEDPSEWKPIHVQYSDGGTEHRTLLVKVQLSLIAIFKMLGLDMLIACRAAPGQSWQNPVERVMATLNIGLQNCALERDKTAEDMEHLLKRCSSMAEIRKAGEKNPQLAEAWSTSVAPVLDTTVG